MKKEEMGKAFDKAKENDRKCFEAMKEETAQQQEQQPTTPTWDKFYGFDFGYDLKELFNSVSKANAILDKLMEQEYDRWKGYGELPENYIKDLSDATEYCSKMVHSLSEYAAQLVKYEMFEKFKAD